MRVHLGYRMKGRQRQSYPYVVFSWYQSLLRPFPISLLIAVEIHSV